MKKLNSIAFCLVMLLLGLVPFQTTFALEIIVADLSYYSHNSRFPRAPTRIPLSITQNEEDITLDFFYSVGVAQITIEDEFGGIVYQEFLDTDENLFMMFDTTIFEGGNYKLKIAYGTTVLSGDFEL